MISPTNTLRNWMLTYRLLMLPSQELIKRRVSLSNYNYRRNPFSET